MSVANITRQSLSFAISQYQILTDASFHHGIFRFFDTSEPFDSDFVKLSDRDDLKFMASDFSQNFPLSLAGILL